MVDLLLSGVGGWRVGAHGGAGVGKGGWSICPCGFYAGGGGGPELKVPSWPKHLADKSLDCCWRPQVSLGRSKPFRNPRGWDKHADEGETCWGEGRPRCMPEWTKAASVSLICKINIHEFDCLERGIIYKPESEWEP